MEIICDTNIWYNIGNGIIDGESIDMGNKLIATYHSIDEFSRTTNLIYMPDATRKAVQAMFRASKRHAIFEPALFYLLKLSDSSFTYDIAQQEAILRFTEKIAQGQEIELAKSKEYGEFCAKRKLDLKSGADFLNELAKNVKEKAKSDPKQPSGSSVATVRKTISIFVEMGTGTPLPEDFDWQQIELLENVMKAFFIALEKGAMVMVSNDWYDMFNMVYVSPERKYWTRDGKWEGLIKEAGMEKYLFTSKIG